jgi:hypothetical protein
MKTERLAQPDYKEEYEMPAGYQAQLKQLVEMIEARDEYAKSFSALPPDVRRAAQPHYDELCRSIEDLEQKMADEYERFQEEQRREQELYELTYLQETISEELFIRVKHRKPYLFKKFEEYATRGMTVEEREEQYEIIARREVEELEDILSGKISAPEYHNPFINLILPKDQIRDLLLDINLVAFETDDYYKENLELMKNAEQARRKLALRASDALPVRRRNLEKTVRDLRSNIRAGKQHLLDYFKENKENGKFIEIEKPDQEKLDELFKEVDAAHERLFIVIKHTQPERFEEFEKIAVSDYDTPEQIAAFYERIAEREQKQLKALLKSIADE